jgi:hypothetical protein
MIYFTPAKGSYVYPQNSARISGRYGVAGGARWHNVGSCQAARFRDRCLEPIETDIDPHDQELIVRLNGKEEHRTHTSEMIHTVYELESYMSQFTTLYPGDLILTGAARYHPGHATR